MAEGYEDIDRWGSEQKTLLQQQQEKQQDITNRQTQLAVDELARQKEQIDKDTTKTTRGLYTDYQKQANEYGVNAEKQARTGLANSGYSETSKVNLYNNYQKGVTETLNNSRQLKADFDFKIAQAREQGNITLAQNSLELYKQQMQLLTQEYEMRNNRRQFLYQQDRDRIADNQWQQQYEYQKQRDAINDSQWQQQFDYQKQRDAVSDSQWQKQYELSKKASTRSSSSSRSSSSNKKSKESIVNTSDNVNTGSNTGSNSEPTPKEIIGNIKTIQGPGLTNNIKDGLTGKTYSSIEALMASHKYYYNNGNWYYKD